jgi:hypothetical protein
MVTFAPWPIRHGDELGDQIGAGHTTAALLLEHARNISEESGAQAWLILNAAHRKRYMSSLCRDGAAGDLSFISKAMPTAWRRGSASRRGWNSQRPAPAPGARLSRAYGALARANRERRGCGHDGQRIRVAHMPQQEQQTQPLAA